MKKENVVFGSNKPNESVLLGRDVSIYAKSTSSECKIKMIKIFGYYHGNEKSNDGNYFETKYDVTSSSDGTDFMLKSISFKIPGSYTLVCEAVDMEGNKYRQSFAFNCYERKNVNEEELKEALRYIDIDV